MRQNEASCNRWCRAPGALKASSQGSPFLWVGDDAAAADDDDKSKTLQIINKCTQY
jgi:hypothetical protein